MFFPFVFIFLFFWPFLCVCFMLSFPFCRLLSAFDLVWFYVFVSLVFSICFHFGVCLLVWLLSSFLFSLFFKIFFSFLFVSAYVYVSLCDIVCLVLLLPFVLGFCMFVFFFFFFLFFSAMQLAWSWCSSWGLGLSLWGRRAEYRKLDHQRTPSPMEYKKVRALPEVSISTVRPRCTQWPASSSVEVSHQTTSKTGTQTHPLADRLPKIILSLQISQNTPSDAALPIRETRSSSTYQERGTSSPTRKPTQANGPPSLTEDR